MSAQYVVVYPALYGFPRRYLSVGTTDPDAEKILEAYYSPHQHLAARFTRHLAHRLVAATRACGPRVHVVKLVPKGGAK